MKQKLTIALQTSPDPCATTYIMLDGSIKHITELFKYGVSKFDFNKDSNYDEATKILRLLSISPQSLVNSFAISDPTHTITMWYPQSGNVGFRFYNREKEAQQFAKRFPIVELVHIDTSQLCDPSLEAFVNSMDETLLWSHIPRSTWIERYPVLSQFNQNDWWYSYYQQNHYMCFKKRDDAILFKLTN